LQAEAASEEDLEFMKDYLTDRIRNVVLVGHSGSGKTSIAEAMLFASGALTRMGRIEDGNTVADYDAEERRRGISINLSNVPVEWQDYKINLIDTPGYLEFMGEIYSGTSVADAAVVVVDAVGGVEVGTELAWQIAGDMDVPRIILVNKMDRENASVARVMEDLRTSFEGDLIPVQVPIDPEASLSGIINLFNQKAYMGPEGKKEDLSGDIAEAVADDFKNMMEAAAEGDDDLIMKYLEGEDLTTEEIKRGLIARMGHGDVIPVCFSSATDSDNVSIGIQALLDTLIALVPSFDRSEGTAATDASDEELILPPQADGPLVLYAFKTIADPYVGKLTYFRVVSGELDMDEGRLVNTRTRNEERMGQLYVMRGKDQITVKRLALGDIGALAKLGETITGDTLCTKAEQYQVTPPAFPNPLFEVAVSPKTQQDSAKMGPALTRLQEQDPTLRWRFEPGTRQTLLAGMGDVHVDVAVNGLEEKFGVGVEISVPKVPYKETVTRSATEQYRHKKQTGGAGQFAEVHMEVRPLERGGGFEYDTDRVYGGSIGNQFFPSIEKGIKSVLEGGVIAGYPVEDVRCEVYDGKMHPVDSKDIAFQIAGREAFKKAFEKAGPVLLEPIVNVRVIVPEEYVSNIIGDLNTRRAMVQGMSQERKKSVIEAQVPLAEMQRYAAELRSMTQGRGIYSIEPAYYKEVPSHIEKDIVEAAMREKEESR
jgi:elongation factor G